ncbi:phosphatidylinositol-4-phosphate 5-kinase family protein [Striga asiatica]|uniref:Phosphatidylinositol-4-phosphate 5-kinase family protein n=1 Tax=Striga asiatica TaxID=4170 RepID=A0A5A7PXZ7_STRAF|nr:phosphatidylinositol-4-phosphate 5-kinase family protein [Striga asiatica]
MDGQKSQAKLTRTTSSLLRFSPTVRSSIQSLSSVSEIEADDLEEQKPHGRPVLSPVRPVSRGWHREDVPASENLLLALIFVAVFLFYLTRNKNSLSRSFDSFKQICDLCARKLGSPCFDSRAAPSKPVWWFIGDSDLDEIERDRRLREGIEFYSIGDFYEGEFHKGRCNGSGVHNYFVNGRYEGDWVDGKFYTGDSYAGEWCNGQSHGVGVQTCGDGSGFIGEFRRGVKHGLGCYHFSLVMD